MMSKMRMARMSRRDTWRARMWRVALIVAILVSIPALRSPLSPAHRSGTIPERNIAFITSIQK
jgi:hypothetical protein